MTIYGNNCNTKISTMYLCSCLGGILGGAPMIACKIPIKMYASQLVLCKLTRPTPFASLIKSGCLLLLCLYHIAGFILKV